VQDAARSEPVSVSDQRKARSRRPLQGTSDRLSKGGRFALLKRRRYVSSDAECNGRGFFRLASWLSLVSSALLSMAKRERSSRERR